MTGCTATCPTSTSSSYALGLCRATAQRCDYLVGGYQGDWETFPSNPAALNPSISGIPYWSADIGGFSAATIMTANSGLFHALAPVRGVHSAIPGARHRPRRGGWNSTETSSRG